MTAPQTVKRGLAGWSTRDLLVMVTLGIAFGLLLSGARIVLAGSVAFGPYVPSAVSGLFFLPAFLVVYITRRPAAALLTLLVAALVQVPLTPIGLLAVLPGLISGLVIEAAVALATRYKYFSTARMAALGGLTSLAAMVGLAVGVFVMQLFEVTLWMAGLAFVLAAGSSMLAGVSAKWLADGMVKTGVLTGTALGQEVVSEV